MSSVEDFADQLFSVPPGRQGTVNLDIDVDEPSEFFEVLLLIMTQGLKKWYGARINIGDVSAEHIVKLQEYFLSFGIRIIVDRVAEPGVYMIDNKAYMEKKKLEEMTFTVAANKHLYTVHFEFAPGVDARWS